ncbi:L,D-transpeptidase family protein [Brotaphodocola sp.]|uniref:L,D-transpeptidase family protein n=1 Tax=Brotaphodocola sp. TaxID=3073577 RepID=UPI003D7E57FD
MKKKTGICIAAAALLMATPVWAGSPVIAAGNASNHTTTTSAVSADTVQLNQSPSQGIKTGVAATQPANGEAVTLPLLDESRPVVSETFVPEKFVLSQDASVLVVVEGRGGTDCQVYAYEKNPDGTGWTKRLEVAGHLGENGMSNDRHEGDKTTPIGVFKMNTPFGQAQALEGFPSDYIQVDNSYVWEETSNKLVKGSTQDGERVGSQRYAKFYNYVIDAGYNPNAVSGRGSALFLHCDVPGDTETSGCVEIPEADMITIMKLYGKYGSGHSYIAQAPQGTFDQIYNSYGVNNGLSPEGTF